jgi:hypothetical protein
VFATVFFFTVSFVLGATSLVGYLWGRKTRSDAEEKEYNLNQVKGGMAGIVHDFR